MSVLQRIPAPVSAGITVHLFLAEAAMTGWIYKGYHRPVVPPLHSFPLPSRESTQSTYDIFSCPLLLTSLHWIDRYVLVQRHHQGV